MQNTFKALFAFIDGQIDAFTAEYDPSVYAEVERIPFAAAYLQHVRAAAAKRDSMNELLYR